MRKFNIFTVFLVTVLIAFSLASPVASALSDPDIAADAALLVEAKSGKILYERNKNIRVAPGSIAKVMTLLLAVLEIEAGQAALTDNITASETFLNGINEEAATQKIKPGETMSYEDLLYSAFIASANDACNILAEEIGNSVSGFVNKMNEKTEELGCTDTFFLNPGGMADPAQYTSAWDQYLIFREAVRHPLFLTIAGTVSYTAPADDDSPERSLKNPNAMLHYDSEYYYKYSAAGKMASSSEYGSSLVSYAEKNELALISVVFGVKSSGGEAEADATLSFSETIKLFEWGVSGFAWQDIVKESEIAANEKIALAKDAALLDIKPSETITILARNDLTAAQIERDIIIFGASEGKVITAPVKAGDVLGEMTVSVDGEVCGKVDLIAAHAVALDRVAFMKSQIVETLSKFWVQLVIFVLLVFLGIYIWLVLRDMRKRRDRKRRTEEIKKKIIEERQRQKINR